MPPTPVFILCPGRSFSSVVCSMLGAHPQMYGLPELNLLSVDTVGELLRKAARPGRRYLRAGLVRTIAELHRGEQTEDTVKQANAWLRARRDWPAKDMYDHIAARVAPRRCIDKSPRYSAKPSLRRIRQAYPDAQFLHLGRHPRGAGISRFKVMADAKGSGRLRFARRSANDIEGAWIKAQGDVLAFLDALPSGQRMFVQGEELLADPEGVLPRIAEWLAIAQDATAIEAMMHPENNPYACVGPANAQGGNNPGFMRDPALRIREYVPESLDGPLEWLGPASRFSNETREIAHRLGYV